MSTGVVTAVTTDWRGDTLEAATLATDAELLVGTVVDFDEAGGWLVVADSDPIEYLTVDEDTDTVTLGAAIGGVYELGSPVNLWDPTVPNGGSQVVEYVATVDLHDGTGTPAAVIPHALVPTAGVDNLVGATVRIEVANDDDWQVAQVLGRKPTVVQGFVESPMV